jgi:RNA polymerase subunit RPABC4/transcription elongation factor Spt4
MALSCSNCGKELPDDAKFCLGCGSQVATPDEKPIPRFCLQCGVQLSEDARFCLTCGTLVTTDETSRRQEKEKEIEEELIKGSPLFTEDVTRILDFESNKYAIQSRARRWAEYHASLMSAPEWFHMLDLGSYGVYFEAQDFWQEFYFFPTNKPDAHKAFFYRTVMDWFINEARKRRYIDYEGKYAQKLLTFYNLSYARGEWSDEEMQEKRFKIDYSMLDEMAKKDDELFPPPQPIRVEVAGTILNFTTDEGALAVYVDCAYKGKTIEIFKFSEAFISSDYPDSKAEIIERTIDNTVLCAAVFNHIPFVTDQHRYNRQVLKQMDCTVSSLIPARNEDRWVETVTLFRGNVAELDWRGRKA